MEDDLHIMKMEDNLDFVFKWKTTSIFLKMEDDLIFIIFFFKRKMTSIYSTAHHILPGNLANKTNESKMAQFKRKSNLIDCDIIVN